MNEDSIYIGAMADFINRHGLGTRYDEDGYIDHGRFDNDVRDGLHYIYNIEDQYEVVTQYKTGIKHGMSLTEISKIIISMLEYSLITKSMAAHTLKLQMKTTLQKLWDTMKKTKSSRLFM